jgi:hypothetical protein
VQPDPLTAFTSVADQLDAQFGAHQIDGAETRDEVVGGDPHAERDLVGDLERRLERDLAVQLGRWRARIDGPRVAPTGERVKTDASLPESLTHPIGHHGREITERLHAQAGEQTDQIVGRRRRRPCSQRRGVEHRDRQRREEPGCTSGGDDAHRIGGARTALRRLLRCEGSVGDPRAHIGQPERSQHVEEHVRGGRFAAVVAGRTANAQSAQARPHQLHPGGTFFDRRDDRGERAVVARSVGGNDDEPRTPCLSIAATLPPANALGTSGHRARRDEIVLHDRDRPGGSRVGVGIGFWACIGAGCGPGAGPRLDRGWDLARGSLRRALLVQESGDGPVGEPEDEAPHG